ncbi:MAG: cbb3-type cytochrome oxidase assembly protein CcoS [Propylenella sp.]
MNVLVYIIPVALGLGALGLLAFLWSLKSGQYDDLDGAAERILIDEEPVNDNEAPPPDKRARPADEARHV